MLRRLSLILGISAGLLTTTHLAAGSAGDGDNALISSARAQFYTPPNVKRVRIRKKRQSDTTGWKVAGVTTGTSDPSNSVEVTLSDALTGDPIDQLTLGAAKRASIKLSAENVAVTSGETITFETTSGVVEEDGSVTGSGAVSTIEVTLEESATGRLSGEGVSDTGWKLRVRFNADGNLTAVLKHENKHWQGDSFDAITVTTGAGTQAVTLGELRLRRTASTDMDLEAVGLVLVETELYAPDGTLLDSRSETTNVTTVAAPPALTKIKARQTNGGDAKLVTWTRGTGEDTALEVELADTETGELVISTVDDTPVYTERSYFKTGEGFEPGESPADFVYLVLIDLLDDAGDPFGQQMEVELTIPADAVEGEFHVNPVFFADGDGVLSMVVDERGYSMHMGLRGDALTGVAAANIIFEEPFEGPAPLDLEYNLELAAQHDKWIQKGDAALPPEYSVSMSLTTSGGDLLSASTSTGSSTQKVCCIKEIPNAPPYDTIPYW